MEPQRPSDWNRTLPSANDWAFEEVRHTAKCFSLSNRSRCFPGDAQLSNGDHRFEICSLPHARDLAEGSDQISASNAPRGDSRQETRAKRIFGHCVKARFQI